MNLLNPGVEKIILYNADNTYTLSGNDISPESTLTRRQQTRNGARGGYLPFLIEHTLELKISDVSLYDAISGQRFTILIEKFNGFYVWGVTERLIKEEDVLFDPTSEEYPMLIKAKNISKDPEIGVNGNLLGEFVDLDDDNIADGWIIGASQDPKIFSNGIQTVESAATRVLDFGYAGSTYTFEVDFIDLHADADTVMTISYLSGGSANGVDTKTVTSTGVDTVSGVAPSGTDSIQFIVGADNINSSGFVSFTSPKAMIE